MLMAIRAASNMETVEITKGRYYHVKRHNCGYDFCCFRRVSRHLSLLK